MSDYLDEINDIYFKALSTKNDLIFINTFDDFENNLWNRWYFNLVWSQKNLEVDLQDKDKTTKYITLRNEKITKFKKNIYTYWWSYLNISNTWDVFTTLYKFFKTRK